jgi:hypothetical protein
MRSDVINLRETVKLQFPTNCMEYWPPPWLRGLVAGFPQRRLGLEIGSGHVGFVVDKVALGQIFYEY